MRAFFESETDENHRLTVPQLAEKLTAQGIPCERKSIYTDIEALRQMGYDILLQRGRGGGYWLAHRTFELAELKLLVDAVQSCRFIPQDKTGNLIAKLERLASRYEAAQLQRQVYVAGRPRSQNPSVLTASTPCTRPSTPAGRSPSITPTARTTPSAPGAWPGTTAAIT